MKTVVLGLFDDPDGARRVLRQLAASPLDLSTIQVVHAEPQTQRDMAREAGLPARHGIAIGLVAGAVLGGALGALAATGAGVLAALGPLLSGAAGVLLGGAIGATMGAVTGAVRIPREQQVEVLAAIEGGATAVLVQTDKLPTARAIGDLFRANGSRILADDAPMELEEFGRYAPRAAAVSAPELQEDHSRFAPPSRRPEEEPAGDPPPAASGPSAY